MKSRQILAVVALSVAFTNAARAVQYPTILAPYTQEIYAAPVQFNQEAGMAWTTGGNLLTRSGSTINEYPLAPNAVVNGTNTRNSPTVHTITGLNTTGYGMVRALDGYIYTTTSTGLQRFDPSNWAAPAQSLAGTAGGNGWGITALADGRVAYSDGAAGNVYIYNPSNGNNTLIYPGIPSTGPLIDDIEASASGVLALANQANNTITIITTGGTVLNTVSTGTHHPDGLAFGVGSLSTTDLYSNNNDGTISHYVFGLGYLGTPTITDIAFNSGAYGDLAAVGPDCAFYVTQSDNGGLNGSVNGVGTNWDNATTTNQPSIIRIGVQPNSDGSPADCLFTYALEGIPTPEPTSAMTVAAGGALLLRRRRRNPQQP